MRARCLLLATILLAFPVTSAQASFEVSDLVDAQFVSAAPFGGSPPTLVDFDFEIQFRADAPASYWVENLGLELVASASSWDLGMGNITETTQAQADLLEDAFLSSYSDVDFVAIWLVEPGGETPPTFSVSFTPDLSLPLATFGSGDLPFGLDIDITSASDVGDGIAGFRFTGTVVPAPSTAALLLAGAVFGTRRRRQAKETCRVTT